MKVTNITDVKGFFNVLCHCKGAVELSTSEGDKLNLKSTLCQYIALTTMFSEAKIDNVEIHCSDPNDLKLLMNFVISG